MASGSSTIPTTPVEPTEVVTKPDGTKVIIPRRRCKIWPWIALGILVGVIIMLVINYSKEK